MPCFHGGGSAACWAWAVAVAARSPAIETASLVAEMAALRMTAVSLEYRLSSTGDNTHASAAYARRAALAKGSQPPCPSAQDARGPEDYERSRMSENLIAGDF